MEKKKEVKEQIQNIGLVVLFSFINGRGYYIQLRAAVLLLTGNSRFAG